MIMPSSNVTIDDLTIDHLVLYESIRKSFTRDPFYHYVNGICGLSICLLGVISNALSFSVLIRSTMQLSTYVYLAGLCLSDFTACLFLIPAFILDAYPMDVLESELPRTYFYTQLLNITGAISTTARALSVWLCVAFTIDRWIMICRPFAGPLYCTMKNARYVTLIIYLISVFYALPLMFEYEPVEIKGVIDIISGNIEKKFYRQRLSKLGRNSVFRWINALINALGVYVIPLSIIIILNQKLLVSIRSIKQRSTQSNTPLPTRQGITIMLLATTVMLLVFRSPSAAMSVMWLISAKMFVNEKPPFLLRKFHTITNLCATFNAATTFIMFMIYGAKFRAEFTRIYCCCMQSRRERRRKALINRKEQQNERFLPDNVRQDTVNELLNRKTQQETNRDSTGTTGYSSGTTRYSSGTTTSTSYGSLPSLKRSRHQQRKTQHSFDQQSDVLNQIQTTNSQQPQELTIREDECDNLSIDNKAVASVVSPSDWFQALIHCR